MKNDLQTNPILFKMVVLVTCFLMAILYNKSKAAEMTADKVAVNFLHDIKKHELRVTLVSDRTTNLQLFIFSPDGLLITETNVNSLVPTTIKNVKRGFYTYECFNKDTRMKQGSFIVK